MSAGHCVRLARHAKSPGRNLTLTGVRFTLGRHRPGCKRGLRLTCLHRIHTESAMRIAPNPPMSLKKWCPGAELNHRHTDFQSVALPTELPGRRERALIEDVSGG